MQAADLDGVTHHIDVGGRACGRPVLFINSLGADLRMWDPLLGHLPAGLRVIRYDMRGHGLSDCPPGPYAMDDLVADAARLLDHLGVRAAVVVGLSIGGMVAQGLAAMRPDLVSGLVVSNSAARIGTEEMWLERVALVERAGVGALADGVLERWFTAGFREGREIALWRHMLVRQPAAGYAACAAGLAAADLTATTRSLALPTLVIAAERDGSTPPELVRATADLIPGARFDLIEGADMFLEGAGHLPHVERPEAYGRLLSDFILERGEG